jgi:hypothetical protein
MWKKQNMDTYLYLIIEKPTQHAVAVDGPTGGENHAASLASLAKW